MARREKKKIADPKIVTDALEMAEEAGLRYVGDDQPGYTCKPGATTSSISRPAVSDMITEARYQARKNGRLAIAQQTFAAHFSSIRFRPIKRWNRHSSRR
jgi:hypothetical protein